uniref:Reelin domain-containing protein n=1 Tax=Panagrolaimus superbus TaxID=310955 RepID=A0A914Z6D9_9BILA
MFLKLVTVFVIFGISVAMEPLYESSGFHCKTKLSMKLDRKLHGEPRDAPPPFDVQVLDEEGHQTEYYEPGKIYTIRLIGYQYYRGLLLQPRLCDEHGFVIGSLRGGRFLETPDWIQYGIRLQECDMRYPLEDSVTHADDSRKFVTQVQWTAGRDVGNIQFMFTIVSENDVFWERWRPRSGFLQPIYSKQFPSEILRQVFYNEKSALKFLAGKFTSSSQESKSSKEKEKERMPKLEEILITTDKPEMPMEAKKVLEKMEMPEFWLHHDGEVKVHGEEKSDNLEMKQKKEGESEFISDNKNSGEAKINEEMIEEITESDEERVEEKPFIGGALMEGENDTITITSIPDHESITHLPETTKIDETKVVTSLDSGEATLQPSNPETLKNEKPLLKAVAFEEAFSHDDIQINEVQATIAPETLGTIETNILSDETTTLSSSTESETTSSVTVETTENPTTETTSVIIDKAELKTSVSEIFDTTTLENITENPSDETIVTEPQAPDSTPPTTEEEVTTIQSEKTETEKIDEEESRITTKVMDEFTAAETTVNKDIIENNADETNSITEQKNAVEDVLEVDKVMPITEDIKETTEASLKSETTKENQDTVEEATTEIIQEDTTQASIIEAETQTAEEEMKDIENDLSHVTETSDPVTESVQDEISNDSESGTTTEATLSDDGMTENGTTEDPTTESEINDTTTMLDEVTKEITEMPMEERTESLINDETTKESTSQGPETSEASETNIEEAKEEGTSEAPKSSEGTTVTTMEEIEIEGTTSSDIIEKQTQMKTQQKVQKALP